MKEFKNVRPFSREGRKDEELAGLSVFALVPAAVPSDFVARVMRGLPVGPEARKSRMELWRWAAALLIFSGALGYGFSIAEQTADSVASLSSTPADSDSSLLHAL